jgi:predicted dehydrogenase
MIRHTGFLLDGGVHSAALLRVILPDTPGSVVSVASLHRRLFPPHDTIQAIILPEEEAIVDPHGPTTKLVTQSKSGGSQPSGRSIPAGTLTMSWALPDLEKREPKIHQILSVTCLNGRLTLINDNQTRYLEVFPSGGSDVERVSESSVKLGVEVEIAWFANAIHAKRAGKEVNPEEDYGKPINMCWDVAFIQSLLESNGTKRSIRETLGSL